MIEEIASIKKNTNPEYITKEDFEFRLKEIAKCKRDIVYFAETYFKIIHGKLQTIKLYDIQKEFLSYLVENKRIICTSGRQQGKSTIYCIYSLWLTCFFPEKKVMILANKLPTALEILGKIAMAYEYLPDWLKPSVVTFNKGEIAFANRSVIRGFASSSDAARGWSAQCVILDEFAFLQKNIADKLFTSMFPVISSFDDGKIIMVSTPNGIGNLFYDIWKQANSKDENGNKDGWKPFIMWWWQVPGHDENWKKSQIAAIGAERFAQEFNNEFLAGSSFKKLLSDDIVEKYRIQTQEFKLQNKFQPKILTIPLKTGDKAYQFTMWQEFKEGHTYAASGDVGEGVGQDYSVIYVFDITDLSNITLCARFWNNKISPIEFAYVTLKILNLYGNPYFACESNAVGSAYLDSLRVTYEYQNIVMESKDNGIGIRSHVQVKGKACLWMKDMFTTKGIGWTLPDLDLLNEMSNFVKKDTKQHISYAAMSGSHDDLVMAVCWLTYILQPEIIEKYFIVTETFTSELDQILPLKTQPLEDYTSSTLDNIYADPLYQQFMFLREEFAKESMKLKKIEEKTSKKDEFFDPVSLGEIDVVTERKKLLNQNQSKFGGRGKSFFILGSSESYDGYDFDGPSW